ncbi:hypothetical protein B7O87_10585 [Cylindrospermopsis raciborskii CENA303]|uniref:Uncharacterized protein n=1 Tax=Cylindrospermopsis raciborskii CENA303 TaxID=1170769 RepID=A0A1X4G523_9CYAN|nr:hypothetical protein [Cylindrospermopsis raciborskii]EFA73914.1 hypothetical protein CRD_01007 [Raphidiopsis brookii D9]OSO89608.1 hypothetical protein B7O87_10585 [Cylindrospermopsis raciborskii CENA303]
MPVDLKEEIWNLLGEDQFVKTSLSEFWYKDLELDDPQEYLTQLKDYPSDYRDYEFPSPTTNDWGDPENIKPQEEYQRID